jgi:hypothetical protein
VTVGQRLHGVRQTAAARPYQLLARLRAWLRPLFGEVADRQCGQVLMLLIIAGTGISLLRQAGAPALDTIWAEDGARFLNDALKLPAWQSILHPYAGYLHLWPRIMGELVTILPITWAAAAFALTAAVLTAAVGALVYVAASGHLQSVAARVFIALFVTLAPNASFEVLNTTAAAQWPLMFAVFWVLLWRPRGRGGVIVACLTALVGTLSAPLAVMFIPLAILRLFALDSWRERLPALIVLAGSTIQVAVTLSQPFLSQAGAALRDVVWVALVRVGLQTVAGTELAMTLWQRIGPTAALAVGAVFLAVGAFALLRPGTSRHGRLFVTVAGTLAVGFALLSPWMRGAVDMRWTGEVTPLGGARYTYAPILLVVCVVAVVLDERPRPVSPGWWHCVRVSALVALAIPMILDFRVPNGRSQGPRWSTQVSQATTRCRGLDDDSLVMLDHPPDFGEFFITVPCARL